MAAGATPVNGLVVGTAFRLAVRPSPPLQAFAAWGLVFDYYPLHLEHDPGWHLQAEAGASVYYFNETGDTGCEYGCPKPREGPYGALAFGREYWLGPELSAGWLLHATIAGVGDDGSKAYPTYDAFPVFIAVMATFTYH